MYKPSSNLDSFYIAGFKHHEGAFVLNQLKPGKKLKLVPEMDNPYDPQAMAIYYKKTKIGYVPRHNNSMLSVMSCFGHGDIFECRIQQVDTKAAPWEQVRVGIYLVDASKKAKKAK